jgi:hypothetical protein
MPLLSMSGTLQGGDQPKFEIFKCRTLGSLKVDCNVPVEWVKHSHFGRNSPYRMLLG